MTSISKPAWEEQDGLAQELARAWRSPVGSGRRLPLQVFARVMGWSPDVVEYRVREGLLLAVRDGARGPRFVVLDHLESHHRDLWASFEWCLRFHLEGAAVCPPAEMTLPAFARATRSTARRVAYAARLERLPSRRVGASGKARRVIPLDLIARGYPAEWADVQAHLGLSPVTRETATDDDGEEP